MTRRKVRTKWGAVMFAACACSVMTMAQSGGTALETVQLRPNFYMIGGAGGNIGVQVGSDGVVLVDEEQTVGHMVEATEALESSL